MASPSKATEKDQLSIDDIEMFLKTTSADKDTQTDITGKYLELLITIVQTGQPTAGQSSGQGMRMTATHAQRRDQKLEELNTEIRTAAERVKASGKFQVRLCFDQRPTSTPKNATLWRLSKQKFAGGFPRWFQIELRSTINESFDQVDGTYIDSVGDARALCKLISRSVERATRQAAYKIDFTSRFSWSNTAPAHERERRDALQMFVKSRGLAPARDLQEFLALRKDDQDDSEDTESYLQEIQKALNNTFWIKNLEKDY